MRKTFILVRKISLGFVAAAFAFVSPTAAQVRGVYPLGMSATNSGVTPQSGLTYSNLFIIYSRDQLRGTNGEVLATGENSVLMDLNSFVWVSKNQIEALGGAKISVSATLPIANNSLSSDTEGAVSGGGGFADSYYQPLILGWQKKRADIRAICGFLAPTGRFVAGANDNVGSGYWTPVVAVGQTFYLGEKKRTALSAFQMYEFHSTQEGTQIHPGQTLDLDYSVTQNLTLQKDLLLQLGLVGYEQWQTTDKTGPAITPAQAAAHYRVNALGFASNVLLPQRKVNLGFKFFKEFANRAGFQGYSVQIAGAISF
ncbi:MAG: transporter [Terracidiphilus sp.]